jgi:hypothetical protein
MLSKLAKIANRLDSIGLTKEADVLDAFIRKVATTPPYRDSPPNADVANLPYNSTFTSGIHPEEIQPQPGSPFLRTDTVGWEKYEAATGMIGTTVRQAWVRYTQSGAAGVDPSFKSFTSWYNNQLKNVWGGKHKSPSEVIKLLNERATAQAMAGSHVDASSPSAIAQYDKDFEKDLADPWKSGSGSAQAARPSPVSGSVFEGVNLTAEERQRATNELNKAKRYGQYANE